MNALSILFAAVMLGPWRTYEVYQPTIERHFVLDAYAQELKYNHDSTIAWFKDRWICCWNANQPPVEGKPGQLNYMSTSPEGKTWSPALPAFSSEKRCVNPVPCPTGTQWQPNFVIVNDVLWAVWCQNSRDKHKGCYVSRLKEPDGKWVNRLLLWDGNPKPEIGGKRWRLFPTQNPIQLRSGRVLAPLTMTGPMAADAPSGLSKAWWGHEKRNTVLYTDDAGATWHVSPGTILPGKSWAQWEPTVWELPDGTVMMLARNNDHRDPALGGPRPAEALTWSLSRDGGATWTPHEYVPLETVCSRMHVLPAGGNRWMMTHNDWPAGTFVQDRLNLALFFTRGPGIDFVAGPGYTAHEPVVCYPQMWVRGNKVLISYSQGPQIRSIKVAHISPLPDPTRYYLFPRSNIPDSPAPDRVGKAYCFNGHQSLTTREPVDPGDNGFSAGAWVRATNGGALLDTRVPKPRGGFVWALRGGDHGLHPFVFLYTPEINIMPSLTVPPNEWVYVGITVDKQEGWIDFYVNGKSERVRPKTPPSHPLKGTTGRIGAKRPEHSKISGLHGELRVLSLYANARWGKAEHHGLHNQYAAELGRPLLDAARKPDGTPALLCDPPDTDGIQRNFIVPEGEIDRIEVAKDDGLQVLRFTGQTSAGVDLDENDRQRGDRVDFAFRFRIEEGEEHVLCTVGDAVHPARLIARGNELILRAGGQDAACGRITPEGWAHVEITTVGDKTSARMKDGQWATVTHRPLSTWLYLGQGYRQKDAGGGGRFIVDVASVRSRVVRAKSTE